MVRPVRARSDHLLSYRRVYQANSRKSGKPRANFATNQQADEAGRVRANFTAQLAHTHQLQQPWPSTLPLTLQLFSSGKLAD